MKIPALVAACLFLLGSLGCATPDEPRYASPPPGSHSPFAPPDETDPDRDQPPPEPEVEEEEEPDEPVERN